MPDPILHGSLEEPIEIQDKRTDKGRYIRWEYEFIGKALGFYHKLGQKLLKSPKDRMVDENLVKEANGQEHLFYFDVTEVLLADQKMLEKAASEMGLPPELMK